MDPIIENDTQDTHVQLSPEDSLVFLEYFYPDASLFPISKGLSTQMSEKQAEDHYTMDIILDQCRKLKQYSEPAKKKKRREGISNSALEVWSTDCPDLGPRAPTDHEIPLAIFFNSVLDTVKTVCDPVKPM